MASVSPQLRIGGFYLTLYLVTGAFAAYGGIWLVEQGLTASQVGIINAVPIAALVLLNIWSGRLADRARDWKQAIEVLAAIASLGPLGLLIFGGGFWTVLWFWTLFAVAHGLLVPVLDAATMRMAMRLGFDYASLRAWGTVGYVAAVFAAGWLVALVGAWTFLPVMAALGLLRVGVARLLPRFRYLAAGGADTAAAAQTAPLPAPTPAAPAVSSAASPSPVGLPPPATNAVARRLSDMLQPWFVLPLLGWSLISGTMALLGVFQVLLWQEQGIGEGWLPLLFATGPVAEVIMFFGFRRFARRFSARQLMLASALIAVFRWTAFGFEPGPLALIPLQALHAFTYAMGFMGCLGFIANWTSEDMAAEAQGFFVVLQQFGSVLAILGFGWVAQYHGAGAYFASAAFSALGAAMIWLSLRMKEPAQRQPGRGG